MNTETQIKRLETLITKEALNDVGASPNFFRDYVARKFQEDTGELPDIVYITFWGDDRERRMYRVIAQIPMPHFITITACESEIEKAAKEIATLNPHIVLEFERSGWNTDDFLYNRVTAKYNVLHVSKKA